MSCEIKRNWLLGITTAEHTTSRSITDLQLSALIDGVLKALAPELQNSGLRIKDLKGRNQNERLIQEINAPTEREVFRVGGEIAVQPKGDGFEWSSFDVSCHAHFASFLGSHHIEHSLEFSRSKTVPPWLPWKLLGAAAPIRPRYLRVGLERFQSRFTVASLGFMPQVTDSLLIDVVDTRLFAKVVTEQRERKISNPFDFIPIWQLLDSAIASALGSGLRDSFSAECL